MKNIFTPPEIQFSGVNKRVKWFRDKMEPYLAHPIKILVVVWVGYAILDGILTQFSSVPSRGFVFGLITVILGFFFFRDLFLLDDPFDFLFKQHEINPRGVDSCCFTDFTHKVFSLFLL
ncbi:hypothetical protein [Algoriphagus boritolerans]|uniref:hypothetical protein n=1 Tax=Algoriphagus boritolerans TaxID=308111 RepID=UPI000AFDD84C